MHFRQLGGVAVSKSKHLGVTLFPHERCRKQNQIYRGTAAVEQWIRTIREEEALAHPDHSMTAVEAWEHAHFQEEEARTKAKQARQDYQDELRRIFFRF